MSDDCEIIHVADQTPRPLKRAKLTYKSQDVSQVELPSGSTEVKPRRSSRLREMPRSTFQASMTRPRKKRSYAKSKTPSSGVNLMHMPVELIVEIAGYLNPMDVLNMARCSKSLRGLFMSKGSKSLWRKSRAHLQVPDCPEDLSEPQYADLLFGKGCYECNIIQTNKLYFSLRLRLCKGCAKGRIIARSKVQHDVITLFTTFFCDDSKPKVHFDSLMRSVGPQYCKFYRPGLGLYLGKQMLDAVYDIVAVEQRLEAYKALLTAGDYTGMQELMGERNRVVSRLEESSEPVERWRLDQVAKKEAEKRRIVSERKKFITDKLRQLGYTCSDFMSYREDCKKWNALVYANRVITEKGFSRIRPKLEQLLAERREARAKDNVSIPPCPCTRCQGVEDTDNIESKFMFFVHLATTYFNSIEAESEGERDEDEEEEGLDIDDIFGEEEQEDFFRSLFTEVLSHYGNGE